MSNKEKYLLVRTGEISLVRTREVSLVRTRKSFWLNKRDLSCSSKGNLSCPKTKKNSLVRTGEIYVSEKEKSLLFVRRGDFSCSNKRDLLFEQERSLVFEQERSLLFEQERSPAEKNFGRKDFSSKWEPVIFGASIAETALTNHATIKKRFGIMQR